MEICLLLSKDNTISLKGQHVLDLPELKIMPSNTLWLVHEKRCVQGVKANYMYMYAAIVGALDTTNEHTHEQEALRQDDVSQLQTWC